jgi:ribosome maturation protein Sdo1
MRLYFDIDDSWYEGYDSYDFKRDIRDGIVKSITKNLLTEGKYSLTEEEARQIVKENKSEIIDKVVQNVSAAILKKQEIKSLAPSFSELKNADAQVVKYFEEMVDKAIAKRFK